MNSHDMLRIQENKQMQIQVMQKDNILEVSNLPDGPFIATHHLNNLRTPFQNMDGKRLPRWVARQVRFILRREKFHFQKL